VTGGLAPRSDQPAALGAVFIYSIALGVGTLALPLLALDAGYDAATVGLLTATSAVSQVILRLSLPVLLSRWPDRTIIIVSSLTLGASYALLVLSTALPVFVAAQLLQGGARALFWTSSQTHAVRTPGTPVRMLARIGAVSNVGTMIGPVLTGVVATYSLVLAIAFGVVLAVAAAIAAVGLIRLPPYSRRRRTGEPPMWNQPGIDVACWSGFAAGGWRALMGSYVPVVLTTAGLAPGIIGVLLSAAELASTVTLAAFVRFPPRWTRITLDVSIVVAALSLAALPVAGDNVAVAGLLLVLSGAGSGPMTTLGAAVARQLAHPDDEGEAIALVGTFRAVALLLTPAGVAGTIGLVGVGAALSGAAILMAVPAVTVSLWRRRSDDG
jgi:predicted MFS family arabinose efflux permease